MLMFLFIDLLNRVKAEVVYEDLYKLNGNNFNNLLALEQMTLRKYQMLIRVHNKVQRQIKASYENG